MKLTIANVSTSIDDDTLKTAVAAIARQVSEHFQPEWGAGATITPVRMALGDGQAPVDTPTETIIYLGGSSQDPTTGVDGAYGYHSENYGHIPYGFVYLDICEKYGETWTCTLSHEVLELLADPTAVLTVAAAGPADSPAADKSVYYDLEVCDPTQGDTYPIDGVVVSNFVTRAYFGMAGGATANTNYLNLTLASFGVRPGGYFQYEVDNTTQQVNGSRVDEKRLAARRILGRYRRNGRRAAALGRRAAPAQKPRMAA